MHYLVDSQPPLASDPPSAVNGVDTVTLTSTKDTAIAAVSYKWYKETVLDVSQTAITWVIGTDKTTGDGSYECQVVTAYGTSRKSAALKVDFLCEYHYYFIPFDLSLDV